MERTGVDFVFGVGQRAAASVGYPQHAAVDPQHAAADPQRAAVDPQHAVVNPQQPVQQPVQPALARDFRARVFAQNDAAENREAAFVADADGTNFSLELAAPTAAELAVLAARGQFLTVVGLCWAKLNRVAGCVVGKHGANLYSENIFAITCSQQCNRQYWANPGNYSYDCDACNNLKRSLCQLEAEFLGAVRAPIVAAVVAHLGQFVYGRRALANPRARGFDIMRAFMKITNIRSCALNIGPFIVWFDANMLEVLYDDIVNAGAGV